MLNIGGIILRKRYYVQIIVLLIMVFNNQMYIINGVDDCDHCTETICSTCVFNTDGLTSCHTCENCCLRQGRVYQWKRENKYTQIWTPEIWGQRRDEQMGTAQIPAGGILIED